MDLAREAAESTGEGVGAHLETVADEDRVATHYFESTMPGYRGWRWAVVVTRVPRSKLVTVSEVAMLPGPDALRSPQWVPWMDRLTEHEVGVGDILPTSSEDDRLMPAYTHSDDEAVEDIAFELGVGRQRVMNRDGRAEAAQRWYDGDRGPFAPVAESAPKDARCGTCGFFLPLAGSMRLEFGACANLYSQEDGKVVSADHGCGAHSQVSDIVDTSPQGVYTSVTVYNDGTTEEL